MKNCIEDPQKLKLRKECPYDLTIPLLHMHIYPKELKSIPQRHICLFLLIATVFIIAKHGSNQNVHL
jgi:hypothetical protein